MLLYTSYEVCKLTRWWQGFPDHPHRGQATVTYMLEGTSRHEDSAGHKGTIGTVLKTRRSYASMCL